MWRTFFLSMGLKDYNINLSFKEYLDSLSNEVLEDLGINKVEVINNFILFIENMEKLKKQRKFKIESITIIGGYDKNGNLEDVNITLKPGEIISIVGPTGSGKSRLLSDIEWMAQGDTPTKRQIMINSEVPDKADRFSSEHKLVAQLSQNMNFVMDLTVEEFITMHAECRMVPNINQAVKSIIEKANELSGEGFDLSTAVTALSGGQSRALMIADTAFLSASPIILIDEIENAGVDRKKALDLLVKEEKIVLIATHDPILALMGDKRLVIKNGGINKVINCSKKEKENLIKLQELDFKMQGLRNIIRKGEMIEFDLDEYIGLQ